jgi:glutamate N-acetyltransferase/amino-acid N-acetyltransferase
VSFFLDGKKVTIGGMTKGAGMIAPHMYPAVPHATMLCFLTTDAAADNDSLTRFLADAVDVSFNRITVDNDMSTNDTCLLLANGESGVKIAYDGSEAAQLFATAVRQVAQTLAKGMVMDGEGSSKFVEVLVTGAMDTAQAHVCARAIADSMLCKTAWFGCDPNWGRVLAAAGYSGARFRPENVSLDYNDVPVVRGGMDAGTPESDLAALMKAGSFTVHIDLGAGVASDVVWTSDITYDYVKINADYHT